MELFFKDLEGDGEMAETSLIMGNEAADIAGEMAEEIAFAELAERVSAARLVY